MWFVYYTQWCNRSNCILQYNSLKYFTCGLGSIRMRKQCFTQSESSSRSIQAKRNTDCRIEDRWSVTIRITVTLHKHVVVTIKQCFLLVHISLYWPRAGLRMCKALFHVQHQRMDLHYTESISTNFTEEYNYQDNGIITNYAVFVSIAKNAALGRG